MQTWLPHPDHAESARALSTPDLRRQRHEALVVLRGLVVGVGLPALHSHPASLMWRGHERELIKYVFAMCAEWQHRGYSDEAASIASRLRQKTDECPIPAWLGVEALHQNHRAALLNVDPNWYVEKWPSEEPAVVTLWPVSPEGAWTYRYNGQKVGAMRFPGEYLSLTPGGKWARCLYCRYLTDVEDINHLGECCICTDKDVARLRYPKPGDEIEDIDAEIGRLIRAKRVGMAW